MVENLSLTAWHGMAASYYLLNSLMRRCSVGWSHFLLKKCKARNFLIKEEVVQIGLHGFWLCLLLGANRRVQLFSDPRHRLPAPAELRQPRIHSRVNKSAYAKARDQHKGVGRPLHSDDGRQQGGQPHDGTCG